MQKRIWNVPEPEPDFMITEKNEKGNVFLSWFEIRIGQVSFKPWENSGI